MEKRKYSVINDSTPNSYDIQLTIYEDGSKNERYRFSDKTDAHTAQKIFENTLIKEGYEKDKENLDGHHFIKKS